MDFPLYRKIEGFICSYCGLSFAVNLNPSLVGLGMRWVTESASNYSQGGKK